MDNKVFQLNCWYQGHVQGVGFRYQTTAVAKGFEVTGFVENLPDGRVHLYAEGVPDEVQSFEKAVASEMESYIRDSEIRTATGIRQCNGFTISS